MRRLLEAARAAIRRLAPDFHPLRRPLLERVVLAWVDLARDETLSTRHGFELEIPRGHRSPLVLDVYLRGDYEAEESRILKDLSRTARLVVDVGANVGYTTCLMATAMRAPDARIFAFEPDPDNLRILRRNVERNGLERVECLPIALSERDGKGELFRSRSNEGDHTLVDLPGRSSLEIDVARFDTFWQRNCAPAPVDLVKVDVQGHELAILRGMEQCLRQGMVRSMLVELWPARIALQGGSTREFADFLGLFPFEADVVSDTEGECWNGLDALASAGPDLEAQPQRFFTVLLRWRGGQTSSNGRSSTKANRSSVPFDVKRRESGR